MLLARRALLLAAIVALGTTLTAAVAPAAQAHAEASRVVVVGVSGLRWSQLAPSDPVPWWPPARSTEAIARTTPLSTYLSSQGDDVAIANLVTRSVADIACPADGWLALSSGTRASAPRDEAAPGDGACRAPAPARSGPGAAVPDWADDVAAAQGQDFDAYLGSLGDQLAAAHLPATAIGPGAALALSTSDGHVAGDAVALRGSPARAVRAASSSRLVVVDLTAMASEATAGTVMVRTLRAAAAPGTVVLLASLAPSPGSTERDLQVVAQLGDGAGLLTSASTRVPGLMLTTDLSATVRSVLGLAPEGIGSALQVDDTAGGASAGKAPVTATLGTHAAWWGPAATSLLDDALHARQGARLAVPARVAFGLLLGLSVLAVTFLTRSRRRLVATLMTFLAAAPAGMTLANAVPWWRQSAAGASYAIAVLVVMLAITAFASLLGRLARPREHDPGRRRTRLYPLAAPLFVAAVTWLLIGLDVLRGSPWQLANPMGTQPLDAGRFYGMNNSSFAFFAVATLALLYGISWWWGRSRLLLASLVVFALVALVVDGAPSLGADLGGPVALLPGAVMVLCAAAGVRLRGRQWGLVGAGMALVVLVAALADWARGIGHRSHLGEFVQQVIDGQAASTLVRKAHGSFGPLVSSPWAVLLTGAAVAAAWFIGRSWWRTVDGLARPEHSLRVWAIPVTLLVATLLNDSGPSILALGAGLAACLMFAWDARRQAPI